MTESGEFTIFGLRSRGPYVLAAGVHQVRLSPNSWTHEYRSHWTGSEWEPYGQNNARVFARKKSAEEYVEAHEQQLYAELWNSGRSNQPVVVVADLIRHHRSG